MLEVNPYQAPSSNVPAPGGRAELPKLPVIAMIGLEVITLGFYGPYWFLSRRRTLNRLVPWDELGWFLPVFQVVFMAVSLTAAVVFDVVLEAPLPIPERTFDLVVGITGLVVSFRVKGMLEDAYPDDGYSGLWTFLFREFYLQYKINRAGKGGAQSNSLSLTSARGPLV